MNKSQSLVLLPTRLHKLLNMWQNKRIGTELPFRTSVVLRELTPWLSNLALLEGHPKTGYRFRVCGTGFLSRFGREATGQLLNTLPEEVCVDLNSRLDHAFFSHEPVATRIDVLQPGGMVSYAELILPLALIEAIPQFFLAIHRLPPPPSYLHSAQLGTSNESAGLGKTTVRPAGSC